MGEATEVIKTVGHDIEEKIDGLKADVKQEVDGLKERFQKEIGDKVNKIEDDINEEVEDIKKMIPKGLTEALDGEDKDREDGFTCNTKDRDFETDEAQEDH